MAGLDKETPILTSHHIKELYPDICQLMLNAAMFKRAERTPIVVRMMAEYGEERCHELLHVSYEK